MRYGLYDVPEAGAGVPRGIIVRLKTRLNEFAFRTLFDLSAPDGHTHTCVGCAVVCVSVGVVQSVIFRTNCASEMASLIRLDVLVAPVRDFKRRCFWRVLDRLEPGRYEDDGMVCVLLCIQYTYQGETLTA